MAWGSSTPKPPLPPRSAFSKLLPLIVLLSALVAFAFIGYHLYLSFQKISSAASDKMQSKHVVFTKDGLKVGVKEMKNENYVDKTQSFLVKAWNLSEWPGYKWMLWNKSPTSPKQGTSPRPDASPMSGASSPTAMGHVESRKPYSRHSSTAN